MICSNCGYVTSMVDCRNCGLSESDNRENIVGAPAHHGGHHHHHHHGGSGFGGFGWGYPVAVCPPGYYMDIYGRCLPLLEIVGVDEPVEEAGFPVDPYALGQEAGKKVPTPQDAYNLGREAGSNVPSPYNLGKEAGTAVTQPGTGGISGTVDRFGENLKSIAWIAGIALIAITGIWAFTAIKTDMPKLAFGQMESERKRQHEVASTAAKILAKEKGL